MFGVRLFLKRMALLCLQFQVRPGDTGTERTPFAQNVLAGRCLCSYFPRRSFEVALRDVEKPQRIFLHPKVRPRKEGGQLDKRQSTALSSFVVGSTLFFLLRWLCPGQPSVCHCASIKLALVEHTAY